MKRLIVLIILAMLVALLIPISVCAASCPDSVKVSPRADCENVGYNVTWGSWCNLQHCSGCGSEPWGSRTSWQQAVTVTFTGAGHYSAPGPMIYKSEWCDPVTGEKRSGPGAGPRPIDLPPSQPYLLLVKERMWCYTLTKTPILGDTKEAWCQLGNAPEGINDFCLQSNYQDLFGCTLENYTVHYPSREQLIRYYCG